ncbi:MAG: hypothetical protein GKR91_06620 [Pseudomonadales bacterium]|nr:hypothetical protein [Pseudomonadales bacterium]
MSSFEAGEIKLEEHAAEVTADQVRSLYLNAPIANAATLLGVVLLGPILLIQEDTQLPYISWGVVMLVAAFLRMLIVFAFHKTKPPVIEMPRWANYYLIATFVLGCSWASIGYFVLPFSDLESDLFSMMILLGVMAAALPLLSMVKWALCLYLLPCVLMIISYFLTVYSMENMAKSFVFVVFYGLLVLSSFRLHNTFRESLTLIYQKKDLIKSLKQEHEMLEDLNRGLRQEVEVRKQTQRELEKNRELMSEEIKNKKQELRLFKQN